MPRLQGARTNPLPYLLGLIVLVIVALLAVELAGITDLIDGFGSE